MFILFSLGYIENNLSNKALELFNQIKNPDEVVITILFNACAQLGSAEALDLVKKVCSEMPKSFYSDSHVLTSLLDALIKCGDIKQAELLFSRSTNKVLPMFGVMMNGYNLDNIPLKSLNLFSQMKNGGFKGDIIIYLCIIKSLSKLGDYSLCQSIVKEIPDCFRVNDRISNVLIDMWVS